MDREVLEKYGIGGVLYEYLVYFMALPTTAEPTPPTYSNALEVPEGLEGTRLTARVQIIGTFAEPLAIELARQELAHPEAWRFSHLERHLWPSWPRPPKKASRRPPRTRPEVQNEREALIGEHAAMRTALDNIVGPGAQHENTCDQAEHDEDGPCIWCDARARLTRSEGSVPCKFCHALVPAGTAHLHQGEWVGDACCWDERLRSTT